jgi:glycosyltransferase involved in cell wall biosynthesis
MIRGLTEPPATQPSRTPGSVLLATPSWSRDGGVAAHVRASAAALAARGLEVAVLAARVDVDDADAVAGVRVLRAPALTDTRAAAVQIADAARDAASDVIHVHQLDDGALIDSLHEVAPVLVSAHAYTACTSGHHHFRPGEECMRAHGPGCIPNLVRCAHTRYPRTLPRRYLAAGRGLDALRAADVAISYSSAIDRHLQINGIVSRAVVPLFPTTPQVSVGESERPLVLFAGRLVAAKGPAVLIRAAREVDADFVLCGEGRDREALERLAARLGVGERVRLAGWLAGEELARELARATVVAVPSVWPEPFGLVGIEALAAGRAVVASATGGITDWLEDGETGLAVRPGDARALARALERLIADPPLRRALGERGRVLVAARFTPERHVEDLLAAYTRAAAMWPGARRPAAA